MTRREWKCPKCGGRDPDFHCNVLIRQPRQFNWWLYIGASLVGFAFSVLVVLALYWSIDRHMDRTRPETPIINQMGVE